MVVCVFNFSVYRYRLSDKKMTMSKLYPWIKQTNRLSKALCSNVILPRKAGVAHQQSSFKYFHGSVARLDVAKAERLKPTGIIDDGDEQFIIR